MKRPISVVATDGEALRTLLTLHAVPEPRILDVTFNTGKMWQRTGLRPHRFDLDPDGVLDVDTRGDFRSLPDYFGPASWDAIVFDPPHITDAGDGIAGRQKWGGYYGTRDEDAGLASIGALFDPFLRGARVVLAPGGIVLAKVSDQVNRGVYQWQHVDLIVAARTLGMTPCDLMVKVAMDRANMIDPKWQRIYHCRKVHTFWLVLRNGTACMAPTAPHVERTITGDLFAEVA